MEASRVRLFVDRGSAVCTYIHSPSTNMKSNLFCLTALLSPCLAADLYVSPSGSDSGDGTIDSPLLSIQKAVDLATAGSTIYLRKGTFSPSANIQITKSGKPGAPYVLRAYDGEVVIIDGEALPGYEHSSLVMCVTNIA